MIQKLAEKIKQTEKFFINFYNSILSVLKVFILSKFNVSLPKITKLNCAILGNGPSLNNSLSSHPDFFKNTTLFCVNHFSVSKEYLILKPEHYVLLDPNFFFEGDNNRDVNVGTTIKNIINLTSWEMFLYVPQQAKKANIIQKIKMENPNIKFCFYNYTIVQGFSFVSNFFYKKNLGMPLCQNVLGASIFLAMNIGFKNVYLFGADHSWSQSLIVDENNELYFKHVHFYDDKDSKPFITKIYKSHNTKEGSRISDFFIACVKTFEVYYILNDYAKSIGAKIYNSTENSFIDAFERKKIQ